MGKNGRKTSNISEIMNEVNYKNRLNGFPVEMNILCLNGVNPLKNVEGVNSQIF